MDGGSERRREERGRERVGGDEHEEKTFITKTMQLHWNVQCNCIGMFNATALECSMQLHWNVQCNIIGVHGGSNNAGALLQCIA